MKYKGIGRTEWCSSAACPETCASRAFIESKTKALNGIDLLRSSTEARSKFKTFKKLECSPKQETSFSVLYWLDTVTTNTAKFLSLRKSESGIGHN